jgi:cytochrome c-type biogenesis protein CcmH/NrfG
MRQTLAQGWLIILTVLASACTVPMINTDQYQYVKTTEQASNGPVVELQRLASDALNLQQYDLSINYLQRAIKLEPRNAHSWHYLAKTYWHIQSFSQCLDMIERSYSYSQVNDDLDSSNNELKTQCLAG